MIYLVFFLVIAWVVYSVVNVSIKQNKEQKKLEDRIGVLENKVNSIVIDHK